MFSFKYLFPKLTSSKVVLDPALTELQQEVSAIETHLLVLRNNEERIKRTKAAVLVAGESQIKILKDICFESYQHIHIAERLLAQMCEYTADIKACSKLFLINKRESKYTELSTEMHNHINLYHDTKGQIEQLGTKWKEMKILMELFDNTQQKTSEP
jgi:hypothetical protein